MRQIISTIFLLLFCTDYFCQDSSKTKKILIVATNVDILGKNENGTFVFELARPFQYFVDNGYDVDFVTPKGRKVAIYPKANAGLDIGKIQLSKLYISKTQNSLLPTEVKCTDYVAVFYPGGYGQFFDVVNNDSISTLVAKIYENGGVIGTTGHGAASLINIKLTNNKYLVEGKKMTCFPHWSELKDMFVSDYGKLLPFDMQEVLAKRGANLIVCPSRPSPTKECTQIIDYTNRLITGAFASDADWVAEQIVKQLQITR
ncbi:MAG: type 1 glutamine amidotransferase domain-containing protein [Bacteroidetes bacterium]|nr:type 1 glutamine amidotransferase domain-containing protein [Bacteroidota bacterium]